MSRRRGRKQRNDKRVESLLDQISGKADQAPGERPGKRWVGHRTLDIQRNQDLFRSLGDSHRFCRVNRLTSNRKKVAEPLKRDTPLNFV